jgi:hypothetical protein
MQKLAIEVTGERIVFYAGWDRRKRCRLTGTYRDTERVGLIGLATPLAMRHAGAEHDAVRSTVGAAAKRAISESNEPGLVSAAFGGRLPMTQGHTL